MATPDTQTLAFFALLPLLAWRVVARFRRLVGRQRLSPVRPWIGLAIFSLLLGLVAAAAWAQGQAMALGWLVLGVGCGGLLSLYGLRRTGYEVGAGSAIWYVPHAPLGIALSTLFLLRVLWRVGELVLHGVPAAGHDSFTFSPWTMAPVGLFAGYSMGYAAGLLRARRRLLREQRERREAALSRSGGPG